jgi:hypothetical protein
VGVAGLRSNYGSTEGATPTGSGAKFVRGIVSEFRTRETGMPVGYSGLFTVSSMICPHCQSQRLQKLEHTTDLGYLLFRCSKYGRKSNERTGTPFNFLEFPTDIVFEIVLCRLRYKLSLRNLSVWRQRTNMPYLQGLALCLFALMTQAESTTVVIHIKLINGRNGEPMKDKQVGLEDSADYHEIALRTDGDGIASLKIRRDAVILTHNTKEYVNCASFISTICCTM